jgi:uncharacterized iron-regulated membrane protein
VRRYVLLACLLVAASAAGAWAWKKAQPPPVSPVAIEEQKFSDVDRAEYEKWMQALGYVD